MIEEKLAIRVVQVNDSVSLERYELENTVYELCFSSKKSFLMKLNKEILEKNPGLRKSIYRKFNKKIKEIILFNEMVNQKST